MNSIKKVTTFFGDIDKPESVISFTKGNEDAQCIEKMYKLIEKYS